MTAGGRFIVIEGAEGVGKSTNMDFVRDCLREAGVSVCCTREPGGTELGEALRSLLLTPGTTIADDAELLLMFAARAQHLQQVILPALSCGDWVLCDRFTDASYAYQGGGRGIDMRRIAGLEQWVQRGLQPDLVLLLDAPAEVGLQRARRRSAADRFEQEKQDFFTRVRDAYLARAAANTERYRIIDATQSLADVRSQIKHEIEAVLRRWLPS